MVAAAQQHAVLLHIHRQHDHDGIGAGKHHVAAGGTASFVAAKLAVGLRAALSAEAVRSVPVGEAERLRHLAQRLLVQQAITEGGAGIGDLELAFQLLDRCTDAHCKPRFAILAVTEQDQRVHIRMQAGQFMFGKQRIQHLVVMFEHQLAASEDEDMRPVMGDRLVQAILCPVFGTAIQAISGKGGQPAGFGMRGIRFKKGNAHGDIASLSALRKACFA